MIIKGQDCDDVTLLVNACAFEDNAESEGRERGSEQSSIHWKGACSFLFSYLTQLNVTLYSHHQDNHTQGLHSRRTPGTTPRTQQQPNTRNTTQRHIMETLFGITGKDFVITAYDSKAVASITLMKIGENKSRELNPHTLMLFSGEPGDGVHFSEYIERNIKLYGIRNGIELSPRAVASFARRELADSLRSRVCFHHFFFGGGAYSVACRSVKERREW